MPKSDFNFTYKFFHPPQRTVPCHNGLLDIRTKHTIAQDRLVVAEQRILEAERRKSATTLQLLAFEQKQLEKRLAIIQNNLNSTNSNRTLKMRGRSTSEVIFRNIRRSSSWTDTITFQRQKLSLSLHNSNQNLLSLPKTDDTQRRLSGYSDGESSENSFLTSDIESGEEGENFKNNSKKLTIKKRILPKLHNQTKPLPLPTVAVIPPDDESLYLIQ